MLSELKRPFCGKYIVIVFTSPHAVVDWKAYLKIKSRKLVRGDDFIPIGHRTDRAAGHRLQSPSEAGHLPTIDAILFSIGALALGTQALEHYKRTPKNTSIVNICAQMGLHLPRFFIFESIRPVWKVEHCSTNNGHVICACSLLLWIRGIHAFVRDPPSDIL
ncbi:hypothetical protein QCA50_018510 [Cerrena zonata]|uniref:Uncharacterized protein n=1 Tax=Cerrena zonata TaxID=2478898 RepID=A0AAW0FAV3_9APHY